MISRPSDEHDSKGNTDLSPWLVALAHWSGYIHSDSEKLDEVIQNDPTLSVALDALPKFEAHRLPTELQEFYVQRVLRYVLSLNGHFIIEIFCTLVDNGISPPKWVLEAVSASFSEYLEDPGASPTKIGQNLGLEGRASGSRNPRDEVADINSRTPAMLDMAALVREFSLSQNKAAQAVRLKYELSQTVSTIKKWYRAYWGRLRPLVSDESFAVGMDEYQRTKFVESFPVKARQLVGK